MKDLVSVIVPAYNHEKYIKKCIESILKQTYKNLEIFVEDDCSTDDTKEVLKGINDKRLKKFYSRKNKGVVQTINELTKKCSGKYIAVIGSDDIWYPTKIEEQVKVLEENPKLGAVFTEIDLIDEKGKKYPDDDPMYQVFKYENMSQGQRLRMFYEHGNHLCHPSSLIPKKVIDEVGLYSKAYRQLHDYEYWIRILNKYNIQIINKRLMGYRRVREQNTSVSSSTSDVRMFNELFYINSRMIKEMKDKIFIEGFSDLFRSKDSSTKLELLCEKYFLLLNMSYDCHNRNYAYSLILDSNNTEEIFDLLETKYKYTLNDFYRDTGQKNLQYPDRITSEKFIISIREKDEIIKNLNNEISSMVNSRSWKITKPIRAIRKIGR